MVCGSCEPKMLTIEEMKNMTSEQIIAAYRQGYKLVQGGTPQPRVMSQDQNWQYGGRVSSLAPTCTRTTFAEGETINMSATPNGGTGPYSASFYYNLSAADVQVGTTQTGIAEGSTATQTLPVTETMVRTANFGAVAGAMQLKTTTTDSCPTGALSCTETCIVGAVCTAPTCNFVVT